MSIPDFQSVMLPLLTFLSDNKEHSIREAIESLERSFTLTDREKEELLPSGNQLIFENRVGWARTYMKKAGLLESTRRGFFKITNIGLNVLKEKPNSINVKFLSQFPEFVEFRKYKKKDDLGINEDEIEITKTPQELLEYGYQKIKDDLAQEILKSIKDATPKFLEKLVVELLLNMDYGGSRKDAGEAIGKSGDDGIDGVIKEDRLGLDIIYIQAKNWRNVVVGKPEIMKFAGALAGKKARKGIFITTTNFTKDALEYASKIELKIILINGEQLAQMMIDFNVGVVKVSQYEVKKIDMDYFTEE